MRVNVVMDRLMGHLLRYDSLDVDREGIEDWGPKYARLRVDIAEPEDDELREATSENSVALIRRIVAERVPAGVSCQVLQIDDWTVKIEATPAATAGRPALVDALAGKLWGAYVRAQPKADRSGYAKWDDLDDEDTLRGMRAIAAAVAEASPTVARRLAKLGGARG